MVPPQLAVLSAHPAASTNETANAPAENRTLVTTLPLG
jgi:hypothetical protein